MLLVLAGLFAMRDTYGRLGPGGLRVWIRMEGVWNFSIPTLSTDIHLRSMILQRGPIRRV